jgi:prepilin-type N-terminal cleavage/methylation domain-containing protein
MNRGMTMVELLVTLAIFALIVALGLFMSFEAYRSATRRSERDTIVSLLERARSRAMANIDQSAWGVCYVAPNYVITKDVSTCTPHDSVEANAGVAGASDFSDFPIEFAQLTGNVSTDKTIIVRQAGKEEPITINHEGRINW